MTGALYAIVYGIALGFAVFMAVYSIWAKAYQTFFGRHFLAFMGSFLVAFAYSLVPMRSSAARIEGWLIVLLIILIVVWIQVWLLISKLVRDRRDGRDREEVP